MNHILLYLDIIMEILEQNVFKSYFVISKVESRLNSIE